MIHNMIMFVVITYFKLYYITVPKTWITIILFVNNKIIFSMHGHIYLKK